MNSAAAMTQRVWDAGRPVDLRATLGPLRRGTHDPAHRLDAAGGFWMAADTPAGPGTVRLTAARTVVTGTAWGDGADWLLDRLPALVGAQDDWTGLDLAAVPPLGEVLRARPGLRLTSTGLVMAALVPAVLEQKVTGEEARRSWRLLLLRFGTPAPGPLAELRVPPSPRALLDLPTWEWHRLGVDLKRQRAIRAAASVASRVEECAAMAPDDAVARLRLIPGVGEWTAAETAQRAIGHPDAVSVGDYHLPNLVVHVFTGRARGTDADMLDLLAPWVGQRQRVMRLVELTGRRAPRFGPRFNYTDIRAI
ncbi:DNA-3-methyladenine glycosylase family protein [uncultured Jatrophihabitans sp.]|uniref:DNA-3-methyladenine glycosylase family protein n=1 Tax=uncultured Jatrophihabitans sp. TaxID=1610747 RepID=UPI0035C9AE0E